MDYGSIAQQGEHLPYKQGVIGSSPVAPTKKPAIWTCGFSYAENCPPLIKEKKQRVYPDRSWNQGLQIQVLKAVGIPERKTCIPAGQGDEDRFPEHPIRDFLEAADPVPGVLGSQKGEEMPVACGPVELDTKTGPWLALKAGNG